MPHLVIYGLYMNPLATKLDAEIRSAICANVPHIRDDQIIIDHVNSHRIGGLDSIQVQICSKSDISEVVGVEIRKIFSDRPVRCFAHKERGYWYWSSSRHSTAPVPKKTPRSASTALVHKPRSTQPAPVKKEPPFEVGQVVRPKKTPVETPDYCTSFGKGVIKRKVGKKIIQIWDLTDGEGNPVWWVRFKDTQGMFKASEFETTRKK